MATLADSFLDDLDELGESSDEETPQEGAGVEIGGGVGAESGMGDEDIEVRAEGVRRFHARPLCTSFFVLPCPLS